MPIWYMPADVVILRKGIRPLPIPAREPRGSIYVCRRMARSKPCRVKGQPSSRCLKLNAPLYVEFRQNLYVLLRASAESNHPHLHSQLTSLMRYPTDLPDLASLRPPGGNTLS